MTGKKYLEQRIEDLEDFQKKAEPILREAEKQLDLSRETVNPIRFCRDSLDAKIIEYLITNIGAGTTEIAKGLGLETPHKKGRHVIGKRMKRIAKVSDESGWHLFEFVAANKMHPTTHELKGRAWWAVLDEIDVEAFKKSVVTQSEK